jgi:O-antigen ligase
MLMEWLRGISLDPSALRDFREGLIGLVLSKLDQVFIVIGLSLLFLALFLFKIQSIVFSSKQNYWGVITLSDLCKALLVICSVWVYAASRHDSPQPDAWDTLLLGIDQSTNVMVFLVGLLLGQIVGFVPKWTEDKSFSFGRITPALIVLFLAATCLIQTSIPHMYRYYRQVRWTGLWVNPNTYGLLMGLGVLLALGFVISCFKSYVLCPQTIWSRRLKVVVCITAAGVMSDGLLHSYSRGAWLAFICGLSYMAIQAIQISGNPKAIQWVRRNSVTIAAMLCALALLTFWQFRDTEHKIARRAFSISNANDFSLRNRAAAWKGALIMIADKPWFGFGWNQPELMYNSYYRAPIVEGGMAIQLNDYWTLGMTLGLPALLCFLVYTWLSLSRGPSSLHFTTARQRTESREQMEEDGRQKLGAMIEKSEIRNPKSEITEMDWLQTICRASVIVLLVGFWFDGGLFKLALAVPFWILIELGLRQPKAAVRP